MNKLSKTFDIERLKTKLNFCAKEARDISDRLLFVETKDIDLARSAARRVGKECRIGCR